VTKRLVDIDDAILQQAQRILGTETLKATVNSALREVVRRDAAEAFLGLATEGVFGTGAKGEES
jgi:Arc/MetJ family transcription regulator